MPLFPALLMPITLVFALVRVLYSAQGKTEILPALQFNLRFCVFCAPAGVVPTTEPNAAGRNITNRERQLRRGDGAGQRLIVPPVSCTVNLSR